MIRLIGGVRQRPSNFPPWYSQARGFSAPICVMILSQIPNMLKEDLHALPAGMLPLS